MYCDGIIYFHSAKTGHKISAIKNCPRASFCAVDRDDVVPEKYTTLYKSVIAFGKASIVDGEEKLYAIKRLGDKYYPRHDDELELAVARSKDAFAIIKLEIEHVTGKQARELSERVTLRRQDTIYRLAGQLRSRRIDGYERH